MSEDRFYSQVRAAMSEHHPEVPASVYHGMRKKLWWSNFTRLSITRFNIWYALFILGGLGAWLGVNTSNGNAEPSTVQTIAQPIQEEIHTAAEPPVATSVMKEVNQTSSATIEPKSKEIVENKKRETPKQEVITEHADSPKVISPGGENQLEASAPTVETQAEQPVKKGSKKGLKITTYNSGENKK